MTCYQWRIQGGAGGGHAPLLLLVRLRVLEYLNIQTSTEYSILGTRYRSSQPKIEKPSHMQPLAARVNCKKNSAQNAPKVTILRSKIGKKISMEGHPPHTAPPRRLQRFVLGLPLGCIRTIWPKMKSLILNCLGILCVWLFMKRKVRNIFLIKAHLEVSRFL